MGLTYRWITLATLEAGLKAETCPLHFRICDLGNGALDGRLMTPDKNFEFCGLDPDQSNPAYHILGRFSEERGCPEQGTLMEF